MLCHQKHFPGSNGGCMQVTQRTQGVKLSFNSLVAMLGIADSSSVQSCSSSCLELSTVGDTEHVGAAKLLYFQQNWRTMLSCSCSHNPSVPSHWCSCTMLFAAQNAKSHLPLSNWFLVNKMELPTLKNGKEGGG